MNILSMLYTFSPLQKALNKSQLSLMSRFSKNHNSDLELLLFWTKPQTSLIWITFITCGTGTLKWFCFCEINVCLCFFHVYLCIHKHIKIQLQRFITDPKQVGHSGCSIMVKGGTYSCVNIKSWQSHSRTKTNTAAQKDVHVTAVITSVWSNHGIGLFHNFIFGSGTPKSLQV